MEEEYYFEQCFDFIIVIVVSKFIKIMIMYNNH